MKKLVDRLRDISNNSSERKEKRSAKRFHTDDFADRIQELEESESRFLLQTYPAVPGDGSSECC